MHPIICHEIQIINSEKDKQNITGQEMIRDSNYKIHKFVYVSVERDPQI